MDDRFTSRRVKLAGGPERTATWVYHDPDGALIVELYDFGDTAEAFFGNDAALLLRVDQAHFGRLREALGATNLPDTIAARCSTYHSAKSLLESVGIPYTTSVDPWA